MKVSSDLIHENQNSKWAGHSTDENREKAEPFEINICPKVTYKLGDYIYQAPAQGSNKDQS